MYMLLTLLVLVGDAVMTLFLYRIIMFASSLKCVNIKYSYQWLTLPALYWFTNSGQNSGVNDVILRPEGK